MKKKKERVFYKWNELNKLDKIGICIGFLVIIIGLLRLFKIDLDNLVLLLILAMIIILIVKILREDIFDLKKRNK